MARPAKKPPQKKKPKKPSCPDASIGIIGLGAFGQLMARHLAAHGRITAYDISRRKIKGLVFGTLEEAARCDVVILSVPVDQIAKTAKAIAPFVRKGALVMDVASVKIKPAAALEKHIPKHADIICTHPLFGPQSAAGGIEGHKIALCGVRGKRMPQIRRFLSQVLGLQVIVTTPSAHDKELAAVQGITHMIARILMQMEPLPKRMTTRSFDLLMQATGMLRYDSEELFLAIERENPYSAGVRQRFFGLAEALRNRLLKRNE